MNKIDMDMIALSYHQNFTELRGEENTNHAREFSFKERLEGWNIERMQRENGTYDVFYCHSKSRKMFRFITDVVNFLQYAIYYENLNQNKVITLEENTVKRISKEASTVKRKRNSIASQSTERHKALLREVSSNFEGLQNVTIENMLKTSHCNISNETDCWEMEEEKEENYVEKYLGKIASKSQDFLSLEKELSGAKMGTTQIVDTNLMDEGESHGELQDGSLAIMLDMYKNSRIGQKEMNYEFRDFHDEISMDWTENDGLIDTYYKECDLIYHIPICKSIDELVQFLITERNHRQ